MFEQGQVVEAVDPRTNCWLKAIYKEYLGHGKHWIEWYDISLNFRTRQKVNEVRSLESDEDQLTEFLQKHGESFCLFSGGMIYLMWNVSRGRI